VVKLKKVPFKVKLFKLVAPNGDIDWLITNELDDHLTVQVAQEANEVRWQVEAFHRELKQLTGSEKCQCRKARSQRNPIACCYQVWVSLKVKANALKKSLYQIRDDLFSDYLRTELRNPRIKAYSGG
ncbi:MAG: IS701 family transposase, partial [Methylobacter sp.]